MLEQILENKYLSREILGNELGDIFLFLLVIVILFAVIKLAENILLSRLEKRVKKREKETLLTTTVKFITSIKSSFYLFLSFYLALRILVVPSWVMEALGILLLVWVVARVVIGLQMFVDYGLNKKLVTDEDPAMKVAAKNIGWLLKALLWFFGILFILSNLGVEVTSFIAGLGVGGIAIAFALQNILEDLFSSFAIYFDKPFTVGDFIEVDGQWGTVEKIGLKTTRIRALQGEEIVMANRELTDKRIHNFKRLEERRGVFEFGVTYGTPHEKMEKIPEIVKEIINEKELAEFDRAHFNGFGDSALEYEVAYYVKSDDFKKFRDIHESILLGIKKRFENEDIDMAFPTRTVHLFNKE